MRKVGEGVCNQGGFSLARGAETNACCCADPGSAATAPIQGKAERCQMPQRADPALPPMDAVKDAVKSTAQTPSATSDSAITAAVVGVIVRAYRRPAMP